MRRATGQEVKANLSAFEELNDNFDSIKNVLDEMV